MAVRWISYFGYGSLVNRDTRPIYEDATNARLYGWQRAWSHRVVDGQRAVGCTSLTIEPIESADKAAVAGIDGVLVRIRPEDLPALDRREAGYERIRVNPSSLELPDGHDIEEVVTYRSLSENRHMANEEFPILQSYIDCVMAGYLTRFGESGLNHWLHSTRGWEHSILDDRNNPIYPRHIDLQADQQTYFDSLIQLRRSTCGR